MSRPPRTPRRPRDRGAAAGQAERIQKLLAEHGLGSRREIDEWVAAGRVSVNGETAVPGTRATAVDRIRVDGELVRLGRRGRRQRVLRYHKPVGEVCTRRDPEGRPTVFDRLPLLRNGRWIAVGRLDLTTSGLMLFTDDGELANRLMHPSGGIEREYAVRVRGDVTQATLDALSAGVPLDGETARFDTIRAAGGEASNQWFHVTLSEGRNREVRRLWESQGVTVSRLIRVRFGPLTLPRLLPPGRWEELERTDVDALLAALPGPPRTPGGRTRATPVGGRGRGRRPTTPRRR